MTATTTGLGEEVRNALERLEAAATHATSLCEKVFARLAQHRYPIGSTVDLRTLINDYPSNCKTHGRVCSHELYAFRLDSPELTNIRMAVMMLNDDGSDAGPLKFNVSLLGSRAERVAAYDKGISERHQLLKLIEEMEMAEAQTVESAPKP